MWELDYKESWAPKNGCFWTVVLEKTLESPLGCKEIQSVHSKGDRSWDFFGRNDAEAETPVLWPPHAKSWLIGKDPDAGRDWGQEEKGMAEDEMVGWHHQLKGHGFEWTLGVGDGQEGLVCRSPCCHRVGHDWATEPTDWLIRTVPLTLHFSSGSSEEPHPLEPRPHPTSFRLWRRTRSPCSEFLTQSGFTGRADRTIRSHTGGEEGRGHPWRPPAGPLRPAGRKCVPSAGQPCPSHTARWTPRQALKSHLKLHLLQTFEISLLGGWFVLPWPLVSNAPSAPPAPQSLSGSAAQTWGHLGLLQRWSTPAAWLPLGAPSNPTETPSTSPPWWDVKIRREP